MKEIENKEMLEIAERLFIARIARNYKSRRSFATKFGIKLGTYDAHETGKNEIGSTSITKYCSLLNISIVWLLTGAGNPLSFSSSVDNTTLMKFAFLTYWVKTGKPIFSLTHVDVEEEPKEKEK